MRALPWILGGGAIAYGAYLCSRRRHDRDVVRGPLPDKAPRPDDGPLPGEWVWPVGTWDGRQPEISDGFQGKRRDAKGATILHGGVDLMYRRQPSDPWRAGTPNGSRGWVMPDHQPALAASDGVIWFAANTPRGWSVIIDHTPRQLATYYTHLSSVSVASKQTVHAGEPIGIIGADPLDGEHLMHLHFEIWRGKSSTRFDPEPYMRRWNHLATPSEKPALVARNTRAPARPGSHSSILHPRSERHER
jgi:murein DD-endopeptidase MepM/ murein hydrolase activator NlpD